MGVGGQERGCILGDKIVVDQTRSLKGDSWGWGKLDKINKGNSKDED